MTEDVTDDASTLVQILLLTHWGRVTHICVSELTIIGSDNGLSPGRRQAIIWNNPGILWIGPLGTNLNEILIGIKTFSFKKMHLNMSSAKWRPFCLGLYELMPSWIISKIRQMAVPNITRRRIWNTCTATCTLVISPNDGGQISEYGSSYPTANGKLDVARDHFVDVPSQYETTLHCNVVSHWLGAFRIWSLCSLVNYLASHSR